MTKEVQFRRGTTTQHSTFTGALAEVTVDTDLDVVVVHDGVTAGGQQMVGRTATQTLTNKTLTSPVISGGTINNASIGATTRSTGAFTDLDANGNVTLGSDTLDTVTINGHVTLNSELRGPATLVIDPVVVGNNTGAVQIKGNLEVAGGTITGPATLVIDPTVVGNDTGKVQIKGDLEVLGTTTTIDSTTMTINDPLIVLGDGQTTTAGVDTGGFTLGETGISIQYTNANTRFDCTEDFNIASGKVFEIAGTTVLSSTQVLGKSLGGSGTGDIVTIDAGQTLTNKTLTAPKITSASHIADSNGNELIVFPAAVTNAVNEINITNAIASGSPIITTSGGDNNINLTLGAKGTGNIVLTNQLNTVAGTTTKAPIQLSSGVLLSAASAGAFEYDGTLIYATPTANLGRAAIPSLIYTSGAGTILTLNSEATTQSIFPAANDTITLPIGTYFMTLMLHVTRAATATTNVTMNVTLNGAGTSAGTFTGIVIGSQPALTAPGLLNGINIATSTAVTGPSATAGQVYFATLRGILRITTAGTFNPRYSYSANLVSATPANSILAGNFMTIQAMNSSGSAASIGNWA